MKIAIVSLCLSLIALGFGVFATVDTLRGDDAKVVEVTPVSTELPWSGAACDERLAIVVPLKQGCAAGGDCTLYLEANRYFEHFCP